MQRVSRDRWRLWLEVGDEAVRLTLSAEQALGLAVILSRRLGLDPSGAGAGPTVAGAAPPAP